jgi:DNA replication protein DnaC
MKVVFSIFYSLLCIFYLTFNAFAFQIYNENHNFLSPSCQGYEDPFFVALYLSLTKLIEKKGYSIEKIFSYLSILSEKIKGLEVTQLKNNEGRAIIVRLKGRNLIIYKEDNNVKMRFFEDNDINNKSLKNELDYVTTCNDILRTIKRLYSKKAAGEQITVAITGRPRTGKTEISNVISIELEKMGITVYVLMTDFLKNMKDDLGYSKTIRGIEREVKGYGVVIIEGIDAGIGFDDLGYIKPDIQILMEADRETRRQRLVKIRWEDEDLLDYEYDAFECDINYLLNTTDVDFSRRMDSNYAAFISALIAAVPVAKKDLREIVQSMPEATSNEIRDIETLVVEESA